LRYTYDDVILRAHPLRGESHNQRNTTEEVATLQRKPNGPHKTFNWAGGPHAAHGLDTADLVVA